MRTSAGDEEENVSPLADVWKNLESELLQFQAVLGKSFNLWNQCSEMLRSHVSFQNVLVLPCLADHHHSIASSTGEIVVGNIAIVLQGLLYQFLA